MSVLTDYENQSGYVTSSHDQLVFTSQMSVDELAEEFNVSCLHLGRPRSKSCRSVATAGPPDLV